MGDAVLPAARIDCAVHVARAPVEVPAAKIDEIDLAIAKIVAGYIEDGVVLGESRNDSRQTVAKSERKVSAFQPNASHGNAFALRKGCIDDAESWDRLPSWRA
jgi:hypothetical protein